MRCLVISDIHLKVERAQKIIDNVPHDQLVLLGDYFDDWDDTPEQNHTAALWLKQKLMEPNCVALWGNHDASYYSPITYACSGFTGLKRKAIHEVLDAADWAKLKLHTWVDGWLLTHAGLDCRHFENDPPTKEQVDAFCEGGLAAIRAHKMHAALAAGRSRGGSARIGGITWQDWMDLGNPDGMKQICGHTHGKLIRQEEDDHGGIAICLDTRLSHYCLIQDGGVEILAVENVLTHSHD